MKMLNLQRKLTLAESYYFLVVRGTGIYDSSGYVRFQILLYGTAKA